MVELVLHPAPIQGKNLNGALLLKTFYRALENLTLI
jgi:hypothetical protein